MMHGNTKLKFSV